MSVHETGPRGIRGVAKTARNDALKRLLQSL
jgi:hypothetical protein